jgi:hypothetical protein
MYTIQGKTWPIRHMLFMLSPCMTIRILHGSHIATFREPSTYLDGSHCSREKGLPTQFIAHRLTDPRVHTQFLSQVNPWSSRLKPNFYRWQATRLTEPIYQYAIGTFNTCSRGPTHRSLTNTGGGYSLEGVSFSHTTLWHSQPAVSTFQLRASPGL